MTHASHDLLFLASLQDHNTAIIFQPLIFIIYKKMEKKDLQLAWAEVLHLKGQLY